MLKYAWHRFAVVVLLLVYVAIRCNYLDSMPRWDAATYWDAIVNAVSATKAMNSWRQLPRIVLDNYNLFGHPSMGYVSFLVAGQLLNFPSLFILNFTNILFAVASIFSVYTIFRWFFPSKEHRSLVLGATAAYAFEPLFFGCSIFLNTDFPVLVFFTIALACLLYGYLGWFALASSLMIFSKEPGAIFWVGMLAGLGLYAVWLVWRGWKINKLPRFRELLPPFESTRFQHNSTLWLAVYSIGFLLLPGILFKVYSIAQRGAMWALNSGITFDSNGWNCFGFNYRVMANRLGEMFILDFHWVAILVASVALLIALGRRIEFNRLTKEIGEAVPTHTEPVLTKDKWWGLLPIVCCFLLFVAFNVTYITFIIPRYVVLIGFFLVFFMLIAVCIASTSPKGRLSFVLVLFTLFFAQTFKSIDPFSFMAFGKASFAENAILQIDNAPEATTNAFVYNTDFTAPDELLNLMQKEIKISQQTQIIAWNLVPWSSWLTMGNVYINPNTYKRTVDWRGAFRYNITEINQLNETIAPSEAVYIYMPWLAQWSNEKEELAKVAALYDVSPPFEVGYRGYKLRYYKLTRSVRK